MNRTDQEKRTATNRFAKVAGIILVLNGILGFFMPNMFGMHLTPMRNILLVIFGALSIFFGMKSYIASRLFCQIFGIAYMLIGIIALFYPALMAGLTYGHTDVSQVQGFKADDIFHILVGVFYLAFAYAAPVSHDFTVGSKITR